MAYSTNLFFIKWPKKLQVDSLKLGLKRFSVLALDGF